MRSLLIVLLSLLFLGAPTDSHAILSIPVVEVGNPGNGGVSYTYSIGKYEVTNSQYVEFLNAIHSTTVNQLGLYSNLMTSVANGGIDFNSGAADGFKYSTKSGRDNNPVVLVSWYSAVRFANWMHNGQGNASTEMGAYTLQGASPIPSNAGSITRNAGATWFLPNDNEWHKAAYYNSAANDYWTYPTQNNSTPDSDQPPGSDAPNASNTANFFRIDSAIDYNNGYAKTDSPDWSGSQNYLTDVGAYTSAVGPYGTFDQGGNAAEWTEALADITERSIRGGSWSTQLGSLMSSGLAEQDAEHGFYTIGFRLATAAAVPEPRPLLLCGLVAALGGLAHFVAKRRK